MPLGAALYVVGAPCFLGLYGLHGLNDLAVEILDPSLEFFSGRSMNLTRKRLSSPAATFRLGL